jgi:8-oxo-dGTP pyrophosphatase MutT (NUDIX family)
MDTTRIRPIAVCLFRSENRILVSEGFDTVKQNYYYRSLGGGIEYGESSQAAVVREIQEELDVEIENIQLFGVLENIFIYEGQLGHEIVFVFDAEFVDKSLYEADEIDGYEQEANVRFKAKWLSFDEIKNGNARLVPEGLAKMLNLTADAIQHQTKNSTLKN